jgi:hypothetical protein
MPVYVLVWPRFWGQPSPYKANQMTYDLRRLRLKGIIVRLSQDEPLPPNNTRAQGRTFLCQA